jgi:hypothetical protein
MAVRNSQTSTLKLKLQTGMNAKGEPKVAIHTFSHFNPAMADDDYLALRNAIGKLQTLPVLFVGRTDSADLTAE